MHFGKWLRVYALKGLSRYYQDKIFSKRIDEALIKMLKLCPNLHTLVRFVFLFFLYILLIIFSHPDQMIRDKISTATILEIVSTSKSLRCLYIRRNVVLKKYDADWLNNSDNSLEHQKWIKDNCHDYEKTENQVSKFLGYRWHMLSEKDFVKQTINLHLDEY